MSLAPQKLQSLLAILYSVNIDRRTHLSERLAYQAHVRRIVFDNQYFPIQQNEPLFVSVGGSKGHAGIGRPLALSHCIQEFLEQARFLRFATDLQDAAVRLRLPAQVFIAGFNNIHQTQLFGIHC